MFSQMKNFVNDFLLLFFDFYKEFFNEISHEQISIAVHKFKPSEYFCLWNSLLWKPQAQAENKHSWNMNYDYWHQFTWNSCLVKLLMALKGPMWKRVPSRFLKAYTNINHDPSSNDDDVLLSFSSALESLSNDYTYSMHEYFMMRTNI